MSIRNLIRSSLRHLIPNYFISIYHKWDKRRLNQYALYNPKKLADILHYRSIGKHINWDNPQTLNEKINVLKFSSASENWTTLADKYRVRRYINERGLDKILVPVYDVWKDPEDIDLDSLPKSFVLKTNHGAGNVIIVENKDAINLSDITRCLKQWISKPFGLDTAEPHYTKISPLIFAEKLLNNDSSASTSIIDYKIWCLDGEPYAILVCVDRIIGVGMRMAWYDTNWRKIPNILWGSHKHDNVEVEKPACLKDMLEIARKLSHGHPQVRVDLYVCENKPYFGEMTFTSLGGYMNYIRPEFDLAMGRRVTIDNLTSPFTLS